jgi:hypothetical protein
MALCTVSLLGFMFTFLWQMVISQTTYVEDTIYMMKRDRKVIRLKDFMHSGIMTSFQFQKIDALNDSMLDPVSKLPKSMEISPSQTYLFQIGDTTLKYSKDKTLAMKDFQDMTSGVENYYLAREDKAFHLLYLSSANTLVVKSSVGYYETDSYTTLNSLIDESHHFMFFFKRVGSTTHLRLNYSYLDPLSESLLTPRLEFDWAVEGNFFPREYKLNVNKTGNNEFEIFGYHGFGLKYANFLQFFYLKVSLQGETYQAVKKRMALTFKNTSIQVSTLELKYQMVSAGMVQTSKIRMILKAIGESGISNKYYTIECGVVESQTEATNAECQDPAEITTFRLLSDTLNRGIDLGYGRFGIITEQFLLYPADDALSRFEKIYMQISASYVKSTEPEIVKFSEKNDKFIALAFGKKGGTVEDFYIIEYLSNPPEVNQNKTANSTYFRLHKGYLFLNPQNSSATPPMTHQAIAFQDAYIIFNGTVVESKMNGTNESRVMDSLQFAIQAKSNDVQKESKNFTVNLVHKVMEAVDLNLPYKEVKVIRGGRLSVTIKEEYFVGNDVSLNVSTSASNVTAKVQKSSIFNLTFVDFKSDLTKKVKFIKLLYDNLLLVVREITPGNELASICFIRQAGVGKFECALKNELVIDANHEIRDAWLLNFDHIIVVVKFISTTPTNGNDQFRAAIYNLGKLGPNDKKLSDTYSFEVMIPDSGQKSSNSSYICYTYSASAVLTYITAYTDNSVKHTKLTLVRFIQNSENKYSIFASNVTFDTSLIEKFDYFVPDYASKYYFYVGFYDKSKRYTTNQALIRQNNGLYNLVKMKELSSSISSPNSGTSLIRYCAGLQELIAIGKEEGNVDLDRIISVPFKVKFAVYEKMVRRLPLESLNLTSVKEYACLSNHNSLLVLAYNSNKSNTTSTLINYDLDLIHDPRRRIELVTELPNVPFKDIMLTASSSSYAYRDFLVISHLKSETSQEREFLYISQPIKDITFEVVCPFSSPSKVPLTLELYTPHITPKVSKVQKIELDLKPLDYSTEIKIRPTGKLEKKKGTFQLEKLGLLTLVGHFFNVRLMDTKTNQELNQNSPVQIQNRLKVVEKFSVENSVEIRKINQTYIIREVTGNIEIYTDKNNRSKAITLHMQCNSLNADFVSNLATNEELYMFTVEDVVGGVIANYRQINHKKLVETGNVEAATTKFFNQTYQGVFGTPSSLYCGKNFYFSMHSKITNEFTLSVLRPQDSADKPVASNGTVAIPLPEVPIAAELVCFYDDSKNNGSLANSSVALIVVFQNQTQVIYKFNGETELSNVKQAQINLDIKDKIFFIDVECDVAESKKKPIAENWSFVFKCFYSTRWSNDLIVKHYIESSPVSLQVKKSEVVQEVQEIMDFEIVKIIMEDNRLLVAGFNMKEAENMKKVYILVYNFTMEGSTYVMSYFTIDNFMNLDYERFRQLIHIANDGSIVYLDKSISDSNSFNLVYSLEIDSISLQVQSTKFNPNEINLEVMDMGGEVMERISLFNLFSYEAEVQQQSRHPLASLMTYCLVASGVLLIASLLLYLVMNRIYERKMAAVKKSSNTSAMRDTIRRARSSIIADIDLADDDGHDLVSELMKNAQVELELK